MDIKHIYESIMAELRSLPGQIAKAEKNEAAAVDEAGGWSAMGKNEGERGMALILIMAEAGCPTVTETRKRFDSAVAQAGLTSAMLRYMSKQCGPEFNIDAPIAPPVKAEETPQDFDIQTTPADVAAAVNGNGKVEAGLFAELGL